MKVMLIAPVTGYAMKYYTESFVVALEKYLNHLEVILVVPSHFNSNIISDKCKIIKMPTLNTKIRRGIYYFNPLKQHKLLKSLQYYKPDIIHVLNGDGYLISAMIRRYFRTTSLLLTLHDPIAHPHDIVGYINNILRNRFVIKNFDAVHVHNKCFESIVKMALSMKQKIFIVPHGSFAHYFTCYDTSSIVCEKNILFFGRLEYYKGIDILVDAGIRLNNMGRKYKIIIAGPGKINSEIRTKIKNYSDIFELHNKFLADEEVAVLFKRCSLTVLPYRQVTQSSVPSIAVGYGHMIIASDEGAFSEEIPTLGGFLIQRNSIDELVYAIDKCMNPIEDKRNNKNIYDWENIAKRFKEIYDELISVSVIK